MLAGFPVSVLSFVLIVTLFSVGVSTLIVWVGLAVLLLLDRRSSRDGGGEPRG